MDAESQHVKELKVLIAELADALEEESDFQFDDLIQRAREATR